MPPADEKMFVDRDLFNERTQNIAANLSALRREMNARFDPVVVELSALVGTLRGRNGDPGLLDDNRDFRKAIATLAKQSQAHAVTLYGDNKKEKGLVHTVERTMNRVAAIWGGVGVVAGCLLRELIGQFF